MERKGGNFGRLSYYEPNTSIFKNQMGTNSDSITFPYEDYNMAIELIIREYNRYSCGFSNVTNEFKEYRYSTDNGSISFLGGSKVKEGDNNTYLTTNYTDVSMTNPSANTQECLGIESIDITYQSWFHPQVTIKFVDVRGATVMMQAENNYYNPNNYGSNSHIYKAFFSFPYPLFTLKVKGFYGKGVTYKLAISKTKIDFDANTGNFIITADFIGHMYGIFADIPMTFLAIAPYTTIGAKYWKEKIEDGTFCFRGQGNMIQAPMMTFPEFKQAIAKVSQSFEYIELKSDFGVKLSNIKSQIDALHSIQDKYLQVFDSKVTFEVSSEKGYIFRIGASDIDNFIESAVGFYDQVKKYKTDYNPTNDVYYAEFGGDETKNEIEKRLKNNCIKFTECKTNGIGYAPFDNNNIIKNNKEILEKIDKIRSGLTEFTLYVISKPTGKTFNDIIFTDIHNEIQLLEAKLKSEEESYKGIENQFVENALGFTPSIKNIYELAFAHLDTFLEVFYTNMHEIKDELETKSIKRQKIHYPDVSDDYTDTEKRINKVGGKNTASRADYLPPFVAYYKDNKDPSVKDVNGNIQKTVLRWPGEMVNSRDLVEVSYIENLLAASRMYSEEIIAVDENIATMKDKAIHLAGPSTDVSYFIPLTTYDIVNNGKFENPYNVLKKAFKENSKDVLGRLFMIFALRAFYYLSTLQPGYNGHDTNDDYTFGRLEGVNFFKAVGEINSIEFIKFLKEYADDSGERKEKKKFIEYITTSKIISGITDVWLDEKSVNAGNNLFTKVKDEFLIYSYHQPTSGECGFQFYPLETFDPAQLKKDLATGDELLHNKKYISANNTYAYSGDAETFEIGKQLDGGSFLIFEDRDYLKNLQNNFKDAVAKAENELNDREEKIKTYGDRSKFDFGEIRDKDIRRLTNNVNCTRSDNWYDKYAIVKSDDDYSKSEQSDMINSGTPTEQKEWYIKFPSEYNDYTSKSIFVQPIYKLQDNLIAKACIFLFSIPLLGKGYTAAIDEMSVNGVTAKSVLLREGALLWFEKNKNDTSKIKFSGTIDDKYYQYSKPRPGHWLSQGNDNFETIQMEEDTDEYYDGYASYKLPFNRTKSREIYLEQYFLNWAVTDFKAMEIYLNDKSYYKEENFEKGLNYNGASNNEIQNLLRKLFFQLCTTFDYYNGTTAIVGYDTKKNQQIIEPYNYLYCRIGDMEEAFKGFLDQLERIYKDIAENIKDNQNAVLEQMLASEAEDPFNSKDLKLSTYMTMKNLYDKWLCGLQYGEDTYRYKPYNELDINNKSYELNNFIYCDNFFHDIGNSLCVNFTDIGKWLNRIIPNSDLVSQEGEMKIKSQSLFEFLTYVAEMAGGYLLAIPQKMMYNDIESIQKAFTPIPSCGDWDEDTSTYMFLYSYKPSEHLGDSDTNDIDMNGWSPNGDGFNLTDKDIVGKLFNDDGSVVPAFGVTFAKQNQAYFKNINLTSSTPAVTEVGIANTMNIATKAGEEIRKTTLFGQDIYKIYSNYSYECTVEMLGCMQIFPPMYFQLNNIPLWKGAYLIQKVKHSIKPGDITTTFTGVRQNKYTIPLTDNNLIGFIGKTGEPHFKDEAGATIANDATANYFSSVQITDTIGNANITLNIAKEDDFNPTNVSEKMPLICLTPAHGPKTTKKEEWAWSTKLIDDYIIPMLQSKKIKDANGNEVPLNIHRCNVDGKNTYENGYSLRETEELIKKYGSKGVISVTPHWNGGGGEYYLVFYGKIIGDRTNNASGWINPRNAKYRSDSVEFSKYMEAEVENFLKKKDTFTKAPEGMFRKLKTDTHLLYTDDYAHDKTDPAVKVNCACLLTENWFADYGRNWNSTYYNTMSNNRYLNGRAWLESDEGLMAIAEMHVNAIVNYITSLNYDNNQKSYSKVPYNPNLGDLGVANGFKYPR